MEQISKKLEESVNKKNKGGMKVKAHQIKQHCWLFVKAQALFHLILCSSLVRHKKFVAIEIAVGETLQRLKIQVLTHRRKKI